MSKHKNKNKISFGLFLLSILTFFILGLYSSDYISKVYVKNFVKSNTIYDENKYNDNIYEVFGNNNNSSKPLNLEKFWKVYNLIEDDYYSVDGLKNNDLVDGAIKGLVSSLGDKHSEFMDIDETKKFDDMLSGDFEGIGAVVEKVEMGVLISRVLKGSPAKKSGLLKDDIILEANGIKLNELGLYDAVDKIKGPAGTHAVLKILRAGKKGFLEKDVIREKIKIPSVESNIIEGTNLGYISLNMFGEETSREFKKSITKLKDTDGLIIDLRDNGGGYLQSAVEILSFFVEDGKDLVTTKYRDNSKNIVYKSIVGDFLYDKKIVVLINENSASASEITAGALRDYNLAVLVGKKSYGKGSVQQPFYLDDGSLLKITIAKWFTPNDINIDKHGIEPDIEIDFKEEDYDVDACIKSGKCLSKEDFKPYDRQLEEAKKVLKKFIKNETIGLTVDSYNKNNLSDNK